MESSNDFCTTVVQQGAPTVNGQSLWPRGLRGVAAPGRGDWDIIQAARDGNVRAVRHLLRTRPGSLQKMDWQGPGSRSHRYAVLGPRDCRRRLESKPEKLLNLQAVTHEDHQEVSSLIYILFE